MRKLSKSERRQVAGNQISLLLQRLPALDGIDEFLRACRAKLSHADFEELLDILAQQGVERQEGEDDEGRNDHYSGETSSGERGQARHFAAEDDPPPFYGRPEPGGTLTGYEHGGRFGMDAALLARITPTADLDGRAPMKNGVRQPRPAQQRPAHWPDPQRGAARERVRVLDKALATDSAVKASYADRWPSHIQVMPNERTKPRD
jgi:hypothetical protein